MSKINVFIENNEKELRFDTCIIKYYNDVKECSRLLELQERHYR